MIRITSTDTDSQTVIKVAGSLDEDHLAELEEHCAVARKELILDLSELRHADEAALRWLCEQIEKGSRVTKPSPYIAFRLERELAGRPFTVTPKERRT